MDATCIVLTGWNKPVEMNAYPKVQRNPPNLFPMNVPSWAVKAFTAALTNLRHAHKHTHKHTQINTVIPQSIPIFAFWPVIQFLEPFWSLLVINLMSYWDSWLPSCTPASMQMRGVFLRDTGTHTYTHRGTYTDIREAKSQIGWSRNIGIITYIIWISNFFVSPLKPIRIIILPKIIYLPNKTTSMNEAFES